MEHSVRPVTELTDIAGKRVLLRSSLNVPVENGEILDTYRLQKAARTIEYLTGQGARVVVTGHIGREPSESLEPVHAKLSEYVPIAWAGDLVGDAAREKVAALGDGEAILLENVRSDAREKENDQSFAEVLASYGEVYVNDAFADSHRDHASIVGVPQLLPAYAGLQFMDELTHLSRVLTPETPALAILGGAKFETKLPLIKKVLEHYDSIFIGGAIANDFFKAHGLEVGTSLVSDIDLGAEGLVDDSRIIIPVDVITDGLEGRQVKKPDAVTPEESILDIGPESVAFLENKLASTKTVLWNGPVGNYEHGYKEGTEGVARAVAASEATSILGGGDSLAAVAALDLFDQFTFISTAGGAMLTFIESGTLPGITALEASAA